jgi:hypothetical protein
MMSETILPEPKPAHTGNRGPALGPTVWLLEDTGTLWGVWPSRHEAVGARRKLANTNCYKEEWFNILPVPVGCVPMDDLRRRSDVVCLDTPTTEEIK